VRIRKGGGEVQRLGQRALDGKGSDRHYPKSSCAARGQGSAEKKRRANERSHRGAICRGKLFACEERTVPLSMLGLSGGQEAEGRDKSRVTNSNARRGPAHPNEALGCHNSAKGGRSNDS